MTTSISEIAKLKAPSENDQVLQHPLLSVASQVIADNRERLESRASFLIDLGTNARSEMLDLAFRYTARYSNPVAPNSQSPTILSGHQPELFHPGVWFKNFSLDSLSRSTSSTSVNLMIDSELYRKASIRVPTNSVNQPILQDVVFDQEPVGSISYEKSIVRDTVSFASFDRRVSKAIGELGIDQPLIHQLWKHQSQNESELLCDRIANSRHKVEQDWGISNLEVPLSHIAKSKSFATFAGLILADLPRFTQIYNQGLQVYRENHRLRSKTHPAPNLAESNSLYEAPFWFWSDNDPTRQPLMVQWNSSGIDIDDGVQKRNCSHELIPDLLFELNQSGYSIRPRALITTLYSRLFLSDLFLHGIGGAKYDEVTDWIISHFFEVRPPEYYCLTATVHLPLGDSSKSLANIDHKRELESKIRDLKFNPDRYVGDSAVSNQQVSDWIAAKREKVGTRPSRSELRAWHREIMDLNEHLAPFSQQSLLSLQEELGKTNVDLAIAKILRSREYSLALFPEEYLRPLLTKLARS